MLQEKLAIIDSVLGFHHKSNDEYLYYCTFCSHSKRKLSVNIQKNKWKCWVCNSSGKSISYLVKKFGTRSQIEQWKFFDDKVDLSNFEETLDYLFEKELPSIEIDSLPSEFCSLNVAKLPPLAIQARNYLTNGRGLTDEDIFKLMIGYCPDGDYEGRVVIPSFNIDGDINYFISRSFQNHYQKYKNPSANKNRIIFNELFLNFKKPIVIVEGVFATIPAGENSVPLLGSTLDSNHVLFDKIVTNQTDVILCLDWDARAKQYNIADKLLRYGVNVSTISLRKDQDIDEISKEQFKEMKLQAKPFTEENKILNILGA